MTLALVKPKPSPLLEWRCPRCQSKLGMVRLSSGSVVETKCHKCKSIVVKESA